MLNKCDSCGKTVVFGGKEKVIKGVKMFLCNECYGIVVKSVLLEYKATALEGDKELKRMEKEQ